MSMSERSYRWIFWALALVGLAADQAGKYTAFDWLHEHGTPSRYNANVLQHEVVPGWFRLSAEFQADDEGLTADPKPAVNHGALFGLLGGYKYAANTLFAAVSLIAAAAIVYYSLGRNLARDRVLCASLGLILGGTIGNLYDRLVFHGVRDFLYFYYIEWPVFNIADCCLVCGALILLAYAFKNGSRWPEPQETPATVATQPAEMKSS